MSGHTRMLSRDLSMSNYVEVDGGMLVKDVPLLTVGEWTDSAVRTPLYYPARTLKAYAKNWKDTSFWARHFGGAPRNVVTDLLGDVRNVRFDPSYREEGMEEPGAIVGDVFYSYSTSNGKDAAAQALARAKAGNPLAVSVEHGGDETYNPQTKRMEASTLWFSGLASVVKGACERCVMPRANEADADGNKGERQMDEDVAKALADMDARLKACEAKLAEEPEAPEPSAELEKKLGALETKVKELESAKAENVKLTERVKALEARPNPSTVPEKERELEAADVPAGYTTYRKRRTVD